MQVPQHIWMKLLRDKVLLCAAKATEDEKDGTAMNPEVQRIQPPSSNSSGILVNQLISLDTF